MMADFSYAKLSQSQQLPTAFVNSNNTIKSESLSSCLGLNFFKNGMKPCSRWEGILRMLSAEITFTKADKNE